MKGSDYIMYRINDQDLNDMLEKLNAEKARQELFVNDTIRSKSEAEKHDDIEWVEHYSERLATKQKNVKLLEDTIAMIELIKKDISHHKTCKRRP